MRLMPSSLVFELAGGYAIVTPAHQGLFIDLVYSTQPHTLKKTFPLFVKQARALGYAYLYCIPNTPAHARLYRRFGFVPEQQNLLSLDLSSYPSKVNHGKAKSTDY